MNRARISDFYRIVGKPLLGSVRDLLPILLVVSFFQLVVFRQPPDDLAQLFMGVFMVVLGLTTFITGLELGLFPLGESMAHSFARKGSAKWLLAFAFALGFGTTFAEPALIAIAGQAADLSITAGEPEQLNSTRRMYALSLRWTVALSVGLALVLGVIRIIRDWPLHYMIMGGYVAVMLLTWVAPDEIVAIAYDSGGITTSTITVPLTTALGIGLASSIRGRNPLLDGFGLIALASLTPILFVLCFGIVWNTSPSIEAPLELAVNISKQDGPVVSEQAIQGFSFVDTLRSTVIDIAPIAGILFFFQTLVLRSKVANLPKILWGFALVIIGLACFLIGLELGLFPIGESMARQLTQTILTGSESLETGSHPQPAAWYEYYWTYLFAFAIGASTTIAEPSLIAVAIKAQDVSGGAIQAWGLRMAVAFGVGIGVLIGTFRIVSGIPLPLFIIVGYLIVVVQTWFAPKMIIPLAYDSGGVTTSTVTVPLVTALGIGLATNIPGRDPVIDGFGLIAFASLLPIISVMGYSQIASVLNRNR